MTVRNKRLQKYAIKFDHKEEAPDLDKVNKAVKANSKCVKKSNILKIGTTSEVIQKGEKDVLQNSPAKHVSFESDIQNSPKNSHVIIEGSDLQTSFMQVSHDPGIAQNINQYLKELQEVKAIGETNQMILKKLIENEQAKSEMKFKKFIAEFEYFKATLTSNEEKKTMDDIKKEMNEMSSPGRVKERFVEAEHQLDTNPPAQVIIKQDED